MVTHLFKDFLSYRSQYEKAEALWCGLFSELIQACNVVPDWKPWMPTIRLDGAPVLDGNPIFNSRSPSLGRAVRIIQNPPQTIQWPEVDAWIDQFDYSAAGGPGPTEELVIGCALSEEAVGITRELLLRWIDPATSLAEMKRVIEELCPRRRLL